MFEINELVMYGSTGVCRVSEIIKEKDYKHIERQFYKLTPLNSNNMTIKIPTDNMRVPIRKIHTKEEIHNYIAGINDMDLLWIEDDRTRNKTYKEMIKGGVCLELIRVAKSIYCNKHNKGDKDLMKDAERLINEEFSVILEISVDEVEEYVKNRIESK